MMWRWNSPYALSPTPLLQNPSRSSSCQVVPDNHRGWSIFERILTRYVLEILQQISIVIFNEILTIPRSDRINEFCVTNVSVPYYCKMNVVYEICLAFPEINGLPNSSYRWEIISKISNHLIMHIIIFVTSESDLIMALSFPECLHLAES